MCDKLYSNTAKPALNKRRKMKSRPVMPPYSLKRESVVFQ